MSFVTFAISIRSPAVKKIVKTYVTLITSITVNAVQRSATFGSLWQ